MNHATGVLRARLFRSPRRWAFGVALCALALVLCAPARAGLRDASPQEQALDATAFEATGRILAEQLTDIQSVVVLLGGRVAYAFHRDGAPDTLRDLQSVEKSALSALVGIALRQGHFAGLDQPVLQLVPEWAPLNRDPRAAAITLHHLLTMSAGFDVEGPTGRRLAPPDAWARPLAAAPGERFAYDNAIIPMLYAVLEKATGMPVARYARLHLVGPLAMAQPGYERGVQARTIDIAKLGQLFLRGGAWEGRQILAPGYVAAATRAHNGGGPPVSLPYGYLWWVTATAPQSAFLASGYGGQLVWVHPALDLVVAVTSTVSAGSQQRGHAVRLIRGGLVDAAQRRAAIGTR